MLAGGRAGGRSASHCCLAPRDKRRQSAATLVLLLSSLPRRGCPVVAAPPLAATAAAACSGRAARAGSRGRCWAPWPYSAAHQQCPENGMLPVGCRAGVMHMLASRWGDLVRRAHQAPVLEIHSCTNGCRARRKRSWEVIPGAIPQEPRAQDLTCPSPTTARRCPPVLLSPA